MTANHTAPASSRMSSTFTVYSLADSSPGPYVSVVSVVRAGPERRNTEVSLSCAPVERHLPGSVPRAFPAREVQDPVDHPGREPPDEGRFDQECRALMAAGMDG